jgi:hypothetical protein
MMVAEMQGNIAMQLETDRPYRAQNGKSRAIDSL